MLAPTRIIRKAGQNVRPLRSTINAGVRCLASTHQIRYDTKRENFGALHTFSWTFSKNREVDSKTNKNNIGSGWEAEDGRDLPAKRSRKPASSFSVHGHLPRSFQRRWGHTPWTMRQADAKDILLKCAVGKNNEKTRLPHVNHLQSPIFFLIPISIVICGVIPRSSRALSSLRHYIIRIYVKYTGNVVSK
jgi:hypothetical protein